VSDECPECGMDLVNDPGNHSEVDCLRRQLEVAHAEFDTLRWRHNALLRVAEAARALKVVEERWYLRQDADYCGAVVDAGRLEELHEALAALDEGDKQP